MNRLDKAISAHRWVCNDEGSSPGPDVGASMGLLVDNTQAVEQVVDRLLPTVAAINTDRDVRAFLARVIVRDNIDLDFDPLSPFIDYDDLCGDDPDTLDGMMAECREYLLNTGKPGDIYDLAMQLLEAIHLMPAL